MTIAEPETRAVFLDYTGTMVKEEEPYTLRLLQYFLAHSDLKDPARAMELVWGMIKHYEDICYLDTFIKKDEMVDRILEVCVRDCGLKGDLAHMHELWRNSWIHAPLFEDVRPFFAACPAPIYVVTNDDLCYIQESLREKGLAPAGIVAAEQVRACKPHPEIFRSALEMAGVCPGEAVMIGDSVASDLLPARSLSIPSVLIDRKGAHAGEDFPTVRSLTELLP